MASGIGGLPPILPPGPQSGTQSGTQGARKTGDTGQTAATGSPAVVTDLRLPTDSPEVSALLDTIAAGEKEAAAIVDQFDAMKREVNERLLDFVDQFLKTGLDAALKLSMMGRGSAMSTVAARMMRMAEGAVEALHGSITKAGGSAEDIARDLAGLTETADRIGSNARTIAEMAERFAGDDDEKRRSGVARNDIDEALDRMRGTLGRVPLLGFGISV